jgi:hypothetical protein
MREYMKKITIIAILYMLFLYNSLYSIDDKAGTTGFSFLKMTFSTRALGMANAFTGLANDGDAVFFNSAGLTQNDKQHLKSSYLNYIDGMQGGSIVFSTDYQDDWKIAPFLQFLVSDGIPRRDEFNQNLGTFYTTSYVFGVGFAKTLDPALCVGFNIKYFYEKLDNNTATAIAGDFSILHQTNLPELKIGASFKNFGTQITHFTDSKYDEGMPMMAVIGASYNLLDRTFINLDVCKPLDNDFFGRIGAEYVYNELLTYRAGVDTRMNDYRTNATMDFVSGISFGLGFSWETYTIDYALSSMGSLGFVNQLSVSYRF